MAKVLRDKLLEEHVQRILIKETKTKTLTVLRDAINAEMSIKDTNQAYTAEASVSQIHPPPSTSNEVNPTCSYCEGIHSSKKYFKTNSLIKCTTEKVIKQCMEEFGLKQKQTNQSQGQRGNMRGRSCGA